MKQHSPEWNKFHETHITGSMIGAILGFGICSRAQYFRRLTGIQPKDITDIGTQIMQWGTDNEENAVSRYELETGRIAIPAPMFIHPKYDWLGASPDGLVGKDGLLECKCPWPFNSSWCLQGKEEIAWKNECRICGQPCKKLYPGIKDAHRIQCQAEIQCADRQWCDYICWTPGGCFIVREERNDKMWQRIMVLIKDFKDNWLDKNTEPPRFKPGEKADTANYIFGED